MKKNVFLLIACVCLVCSCTVKKPAKEYFPSWNNCEALSALQEYVADVTNPQSEHFIPVEDRIATFDMDGTFIKTTSSRVLRKTSIAVLRAGLE